MALVQLSVSNPKETKEISTEWLEIPEEDIASLAELPLTEIIRLAENLKM